MINVDVSRRDLVRRYLKERFNNTIENKLNEGEKEIANVGINFTEIITQSTVSEIVKTEEMHEIIEIVKDIKRNENSTAIQAEQTLLSFQDNSELITLEDWYPSFQPQTDMNLSIIFDEIGKDKPVHVRLGAFEALLNIDFSSNCNSDGFQVLLKLLRDGISDNTKSVFESSLRIHSKLLESPRSHEAYTNLINIFQAEYYSQKINSEYSIPNFSTGINFKIFIHEKLLRLLYVIIKYHKELLKVTRNIDRIMEEIIDQFIILLTWDDECNKLPLSEGVSTLNLLSLLEPQANWSEKWIHSVATKNFFISAVAKSPNLLNKVYNVVQKGVGKPMLNSSFAYTINDDVIQSNYRSVSLAGDTIEIITYLHCLNFVSQINKCLNESSSLYNNIELPLSPDNFLLALVSSLNLLATSTTPKSIYNTSQRVLRIIIDQPKFSFDSNLLNVALTPLFKFIHENDGNLSPHTMDLINFLLDSNDPSIFINHQHVHSTFDECNKNNNPSQDPVTALLDYTSIVLRQPIAVMNIDHVIKLLHSVGKLFCIIDNFEAIYNELKNQLYPSVEYFFNKIKKYSIGQENVTQLLDGAIKDMLVKIVGWPLGLQLLSNYPVVFDELVRSSINPFRYPWNSNEMISFVSSITYFEAGCQVISELVPDTLSLLLSKLPHDIENFGKSMDSSDCQALTKFIHMLSLLSLNTKCFIIFMMDRLEKDLIENDAKDQPQNLIQLFEHSMMINSPFHYFSLLSLETVIWNLDIFIYILKTYNLESELRNLQNYNLIEVTRNTEKIEINRNDHNDDYHLEETNSEKSHTVYVIDEFSMLRSIILSKLYFIRHKLNKLENYSNPGKCKMFYSNLPSPKLQHTNELMVIKSENLSELDNLLQECKPGLRDSGWLMQIRKAHQNSQNPIKHLTLQNLLYQVEKAISPVEWVDMFKWINCRAETGYNWLPEETIALDLVIRFAEDHCENINDVLKMKDNLKQVFQLVHKFIKYEKKQYFEGFDWFLSTIFIVCDGNMNRCKTFVKNFVRFPSAIYMWYMHGMSFDSNNGRRLTTQFLLVQQINLIVTQEFPAICYALRTEFGIRWWMLCNRMLTQCFWGVLEWSEIVNFLAICILNPPDYMVYYCVSLLKHSEAIIMEDIINSKLWPENMDFSNYQCHNYLTYMDQLAKKYRNKILPQLHQSKSTTPNKEQFVD